MADVDGFGARHLGNQSRHSDMGVSHPVGSWCLHRHLAMVDHQDRLFTGAEPASSRCWLSRRRSAPCSLWSAPGTRPSSGARKPMDFSFLNSFLGALNWPPGEPWMAGMPLHYYYFGEVLAAYPMLVAGCSSWCRLQPDFGNHSRPLRRSSRRYRAPADPQAETSDRRLGPCRCWFFFPVISPGPGSSKRCATATSLISGGRPRA